MINVVISLSVIVRIVAIFVSIVIISDCIKDIIDAKNKSGIYFDEPRFYVVRGIIISSIIIVFLILVILVSAGIINITWLGV